MVDKIELNIPDIVSALQKRSFPTITTYNRLEGRPRTASFDRSLKAEVRDALWMLTRQWQMGEFKGDDAGSPVFTRIKIDTTRLYKYRPDGHPVEPFDQNTPLETRVERRPIPFQMEGQPLSLDLRVQMGRQWLKLVKPLGNYVGDFRQQYPVPSPDPSKKEDAFLCAHPEVWQTFTAYAGRAMDGGALYQYLKAGAGHHSYDGIASIPAGQHADFETLETKFIAWFEDLYDQPLTEDAWVPDQLEYQFAVSAPVDPANPTGAERILSAEQYYQGRLDWYNFDFDPSARQMPLPDGQSAPEPPGDLLTDQPQALIPTQVTFDGMPNTRWWAFEDSRTSFAGITPDTTDLGKLLLIEFGLVYANDWFLIPVKLPVGTLGSVAGLAVTNVFGERTWVTAAGSGKDDDWQRWSLFTVNILGNQGEQADNTLLFLPTAAKVQESAPLEDVLFIRDEVANMVWGIEKTIPLATGLSKPGAEAARETLAFYQRWFKDHSGADPNPPTYKAPIRYEVMNTVPEHWIPFIPVHIENDNRQVQLQRAAMPRLLEGDPNKPAKVRPRTTLLRAGLDQTPAQPYYLHEEEILRAGVRVTQSYQRTRWNGGKVLIWLGISRETGRGEGLSGLAFDRLVDVKNQK